MSFVWARATPSVLMAAKEFLNPTIFMALSNDLAWSRKQADDKLRAAVGQIWAGIGDDNDERVYSIGRTQEETLDNGGIWAVPITLEAAGVVLSRQWQIFPELEVDHKGVRTR